MNRVRADDPGDCEQNADPIHLQEDAAEVGRAVADDSNQERLADEDEEVPENKAEGRKYAQRLAAQLPYRDGWKKIPGRRMR
jgi:hypothetical protein